MRVLRLTASFERDFSSLSSGVQSRIGDLVSMLQTDLKDRRLNVKKLTNVHPPTWRLRIGAYRLLFSFDKQAIYLLRFVHRKDVYRGL